MTNSNDLFFTAKKLMQIGKQKESIVILQELAESGHPEATKIISYIENTQRLTKESPNNPLSIVDKEELNRQHIVPNLVNLFEQDVKVNIGRIQDLHNGFIPEEVSKLLVYQTIANLIEYKKKSLDILPFGVVEQVANQISQAFLNIYIEKARSSENVQKLLNDIVQKFQTDLKEKIWELSIIEQTETFMDKIHDRHFM